jgi:hypothetical protein
MPGCPPPLPSAGHGRQPCPPSIMRTSAVPRLLTLPMQSEHGSRCTLIAHPPLLSSLQSEHGSRCTLIAHTPPPLLPAERAWQPLHTTDAMEGVLCLAFSPWGDTLAVGSPAGQHLSLEAVAIAAAGRWGQAGAAGRWGPGRGGGQVGARQVRRAGGGQAGAAGRWGPGRCGGQVGARQGRRGRRAGGGPQAGGDDCVVGRRMSAVGHDGTVGG